MGTIYTYVGGTFTYPPDWIGPRPDHLSGTITFTIDTTNITGTFIQQNSFTLDGDFYLINNQASVYVNNVHMTNGQIDSWSLSSGGPIGTLAYGWRASSDQGDLYMPRTFTYSTLCNPSPCHLLEVTMAPSGTWTVPSPDLGGPAVILAAILIFTWFAKRRTKTKEALDV